MKKIFVLLFILLLTLTIGFFCINHAVKKEMSEKKKLTFWSIQLKPVYEKQINSIITEFEQKNPEYKVVWVDIPIQEAQKRTLASVLSSTPPDLINLNPDFSVALAQKNVLYTFDNTIASQFHSNLVDKLKYNGKIYALPFYATSPVTIYNKDIYYKCAGDNFIKKYDDLPLVSEKIMKCAKIPAFVSSINENDMFAKILSKYQISKLQTQTEKDDAKYVYSLFNELYKKNYLPKDILAINHREAVERYMSGKAAIIVAGSNFIKMIKQNSPDIYAKSQIANQLTGKNNKYDIALMNLVIPKKSKNIKAAISFALILTNETNQMQLAKLTNVIPANKIVLEDEYFKNCGNDLIEQSRCISVNQLSNINQTNFGEKNRNAINENINRTLEEILLNKNKKADIEKRIDILSKSVFELQNSK